MLMVVFGAGASYDSSPTYPPGSPNPYLFDMEDRLPLADQLFDDRPNFREALRRFPTCKPIVTPLRHRKDGIAFERELQRLQAEADQFPKRYMHLAAVRYYLQYMLRECERRWEDNVTQGVTNQVTLLDQIDLWRTVYGQDVCLVTFNYDTMLESALLTVGVKIQNISDYVASNRYKLIKLHGSVNWGRCVRVPDLFSAIDPWDIVNTLIYGADKLQVTDEYFVVEQTPIHEFNGSVLFPALALPVESKLNFECPEEHIAALHAAIPKVDKLMVIGWRAAEIPFLELLAQNLRGPIWGLVVAGNKEAANETADRLKTAGVAGDYKLSEGGFTDFVRNREAADFLRR